MKKTVTRYQVMIADKWEVIKDGFKTWDAAYEWALQIDYGQFENDGGLIIRSYTA
jgi:hypothetical protein